MKKIVGIFIGLGILLLPTGIYAGDENTSVLISFDLTSNDRFIYEVRVSDGGYLVDGSQRITDGIMEYQLGVGETKEFILEVKQGYKIKEIQVNHQSLETDVRKIHIQGVSARSVLEVKFEKINIPDVPTPPDTIDKVDGVEGPENIHTSNHGVDSIAPITGDILTISEYVCLMLIVLYRLYVNRRGIDTYARVDNIAISKNIEERKETLKEEKENEK